MSASSGWAANARGDRRRHDDDDHDDKHKRPRVSDWGRLAEPTDPFASNVDYVSTSKPKLGEWSPAQHSSRSSARDERKRFDARASSSPPRRSQASVTASATVSASSMGEMDRLVDREDSVYERSRGTYYARGGGGHFHRGPARGPAAPLNYTPRLDEGMPRHSQGPSWLAPSRAGSRPILSGLDLPIYPQKTCILETISTNQVTVLCGDTGSGKTTQVPQYLLEWGRQTGQPVNIVCTQPRRLAAVSIAKRVSTELHVNVGELVGYQVGMEKLVASAETKLLYMTTGVFLQRLVHGGIDEYTHILLDEVHERDLDSDFVMVVLKHLLRDYPEKRLVLMSATIDSQLFAHYFAPSAITAMENRLQLSFAHSSESTQPVRSSYSSTAAAATASAAMDWDRPIVVQESTRRQLKSEEMRITDDPAPIVQINGSCFEMSEYYLEDIYDLTRKDGSINSTFTRGHILTGFQVDRPQLARHVLELAVDLIHTVDRGEFDQTVTEESMKATVLVFLPGVGEIQEMMNLLTELTPESIRLCIRALHSTQTSEEQQEVFRPAAAGFRKIILATNIAESSITVSDVRVVVDTCLVKEVHFNSYTNLESLELQWASKAATKQRKGRAGRVAAGHCFRLIPRTFFESLPNYSRPEIQRSPLDKVLLQTKILDLGEPTHILGRAIQPPDLNAIVQAVNQLQAAGALTPPTASSPTGSLTFLGRTFAVLPCDVRVSRLLLISVAIGCGWEGLCMAAGLSLERLFNRPRNHELEAFRARLMMDFNFHSDPLTALTVYEEWKLLFAKRGLPPTHKGETVNRQQLATARDSEELHLPRNRHHLFQAERAWASRNFVNLQAIKEMDEFVDEVSKRLIRLGIDSTVLTRRRCSDGTNRSADDILVLKIAISGAFYPNFMISDCEDRYATEKITEQFNRGEISYNPFRTVTIDGLPDCITEDHLYSLYVPCGNIEDIKIDWLHHRGYITFAQSACPMAIKCAIRYSQRPLRPDGLPMDKPLNRPGYPYRLKFFSISKGHTVDMDKDSVNWCVFEPNPRDCHRHLLVASFLSDNKGVCVARGTTLLPAYPILPTILALIFAPYAQFRVNPNQTTYLGVRAGSMLAFDLDHVLTQKDLTRINRIRALLSEKLTAHGLKDSSRPDLSVELLQLIHTKRLPMAVVPKPNRFQWSDAEQYDDLSSEVGSRQLLPPLRFPAIQDQQWEDQLRTGAPVAPIITEYERRVKVVDEMNQLASQLAIEQPTLACGQCEAILCTLNNLLPAVNEIRIHGAGYEVQKSYQRSGDVADLPREYNYLIGPSSYVLTNCFGNLYDADASKSDAILIREAPTVAVDRFSACRRGHVVGFKWENRTLVNSYSNVVCLFPYGVKRPWNEEMWGNGWRHARALQSDLDREFGERFRVTRVYCKVCNLTVKDSRALKDHLQSRKHESEVKRFLEKGE